MPGSRQGKTGYIRTTMVNVPESPPYSGSVPLNSAGAPVHEYEGSHDIVAVGGEIGETKVRGGALFC